MAKFDQDVKPTNDPSYIGYSREPDKIRGNAAFGKLFEDIGGAVTGITTTIDNRNQAKISEDLYNGVDPIRDAQGVQTALATEGDLWGVGRQGTQTTEQRGGDGRFATLNRPPNAAEMDKSVATLTEAWKAGKIGDTQYYARLESMTRQVRARYPGYREIIDQKIQQITGVNPANALRREVLQEYTTAAAKGNEAKNKEYQYLKENEKYMDPGDWSKYESGQLDMTEFRNKVANRKIVDQRTDADKADLALRKARGEDTKESAIAAATRNVTVKMNDVLLKATSIGDVQKLADRLLQERRPPTPQEQQQLEMGLAQLESQMSNMFESIMNEPHTDGNTYRSYIRDENEVKKIREGFMARVTALKSVITSNDTGLIGAAVRGMQAQVNERAAKLIGESDTLRQIAALEKIGGSQAVGIILNNSGKLADITRAVLDNHVVNAAAGTPGTNFSDGIKKLKEAKDSSPDKWRTFIQSNARLVTEPGATPEMQKNAVRAMFGERDLDSLSMFEGKDRVRVFSMLASPEMTAKVKALGGQEWEMYKSWVDRSFSNILTTQMQSVGKANAQADLYTVQWDPSAGQFLPVLTPKGEEFMKAGRAGQGGGTAFVGLGGQPDMKKLMGGEWDALSQLNQGLLALGPVAKADGKKIDQLVQRKIQEVTPPVDNRPFFQKLYEGVFGGKDQPLDVEQQMQKNIQDRQTKGKKLSSADGIDIDSGDTVLAGGTGNDAVAVSPAAYFGDNVNIGELPAGMRNNNPGNIKWVRQSDALGPSKNTDQGDPQAVYDSPLTGMTAAAKLALKKNTGGKNTVMKLIADNNGWTPGNTAAARNIAASMNVDPNDPVDLSDPQTMARFLRALIKQEHGPSHKLYKDDLIQAAIGKVLGQPDNG